MFEFLTNLAEAVKIINLATNVGIISLLNLIVLFLTFLAILYYSNETRKLREQTEVSNKLNNQPRLLPKFIYSIDSLEIYVKNIGSGTASDIKWSLEPKKKKKIIKTPIIYKKAIREIPKLWPNSGYLLFSINPDQYLLDGLYNWNLVVSFIDSYKKSITEKYSLDVTNYYSSDFSKDLNAKTFMNRILGKHAVNKVIRSN